MSQTSGLTSFLRTKTGMKKIPIMGRVLNALNVEAMNILDENALTF